MARVGDLEATDTEDSTLNYGIVIDCGSSGSRVFVYFWPPHNGNPHDLLDVKQMRDQSSQPVVKKIKPGISVLATTPDQASHYMRPLLSFAAAHVPVTKHKETPLYILCTAGMRLLPERQQAAILEDLVRNVPLEFDFLFSESQAEVISGKQEGVYAWIGINFVLGRFDHEEEEDAMITVALGGQAESLVRKRTVGILDMGGASLQIAYEVPSMETFSSPQQVRILPSGQESSPCGPQAGPCCSPLSLP
ncbi:ectonucleoside triphosphate diphosphohydrolase 7 [Chelydra serpentina]|uniref:Ectonucleoside triphosphate diphosphohydrolase 7 n=1 Tax=Chelydra serpentina TaxID=8475 RepID=A0A8T1S4V6_CHESE|nr:ectonucleoside triphosphate diphosphohydrolase 7 [Chelydra serpentina]